MPFYDLVSNDDNIACIILESLKVAFASGHTTIVFHLNDNSSLDLQLLNALPYPSIASYSELEKALAVDMALHAVCGSLAQ